MKHRLFISIPILEDAKNELIGFQEKMENLDVRWEKPENFHLTLAFLGDAKEDDIEKIKEIIGEVTRENSLFVINLDRIVLGPNLSYPRMIWAVGKIAPELEKIEKGLKNKLTREKIFVDRKHPFNVHLTLARARINLIPGRVDEEIQLSFPAKEICLMESQLDREGAKHTILKTYLLNV